MHATMTSGSGADTTTAIGPITATGIRPITAMAIRRITATATTHRDLITAITTHRGITTAIRRSGFYPAAHLHERSTLICPDLPEGPVSNSPLKKAQTRSR